MNATAAWRAVSGSVRGSSHVRSGAPNQDAAKVVAFERPTTGVVAAVADGHGGERYVRSDVGARVAVDVACETARVWAAASAALPKRAMLASLRDELAPEIVARWRADVDQHVQDAPFDDDELARLRDDSDPRIAYGATLLMAIAIDDCIALAQLGDGDIIVVGGGDAVHQPIAPDDRLIGGQTTSLCLSTAEDDFRYAVVEAQEAPELVMLCSDGYGNSFANVDWRTIAANDLLDAVRRRGIEAVGADLPAWLSESASAGGDDVTVVVVARSAPRDRQDARQGSTTASKRAVPIITGAVLIVGVAAGWAFGRATAPDAKSAPPNRSAARTTRTTPRPSTAAQQSASRSATIATPSGITIAFNPTPANPQPRVITHTDAPVVITRLTAGGSTWSIDAGALRRTDSSGTESTVSLDGINPAALMASRDLLWVVDDAATVLAVVDPHTGALTGRADVVDPTSSLAHDLQTVSSTIPVAGSTVGTGRSQP